MTWVYNIDCWIVPIKTNDIIHLNLPCDFHLPPPPSAEENHSFHLHPPQDHGANANINKYRCRYRWEQSGWNKWNIMHEPNSMLRAAFHVESIPTDARTQLHCYRLFICYHAWRMLTFISEANPPPTNVAKAAAASIKCFVLNFMSLTKSKRLEWGESRQKIGAAEQEWHKDWPLSHLPISSCLLVVLPFSEIPVEKRKQRHC
jgi:hypothetical protein